MKSSIKREVIQLTNLILSEEWELKNIIKPGCKSSLEKIEAINFNTDLVIVLKKE